MHKTSLSLLCKPWSAQYQSCTRPQYYYFIFFKRKRPVLFYKPLAMVAGGGYCCVLQGGVPRVWQRLRDLFRLERCWHHRLLLFWNSLESCGCQRLVLRASFPPCLTCPWTLSLRMGVRALGLDVNIGIYLKQTSYDIWLRIAYIGWKGVSGFWAGSWPGIEPEAFSTDLQTLLLTDIARTIQLHMTVVLPLNTLQSG